MNRILTGAVAAAASVAFVSEAAALEWNVSVWGKRRAFTEHVEKLAELVAEKTNGEFTMNVSYGGLSKNKENLDGISIGAFEMAQFCAGYHRDKNRTITVLELPFLGVDNLNEEVAVSHAVYQHPAVKDEMAQWNAKIIMTSPMPQYNIVGTGEPRDTLDKMKGMRVRATGGIGNAFEAIGAVPTSVTATEAYQAMESGVVDTVSFAQHAHLSFGTINKADWWTANLNPGTVNCPVVVNTDALNALSASERDALLGSVDEALAYYVDNYNNKTMKAWGPKLKEKGIQVITYDATSLAAFRDAVAGPTAKAWIAENTKRGLPAQELYDMVTALVAK